MAALYDLTGMNTLGGFNGVQNAPQTMTTTPAPLVGPNTAGGAPQNGVQGDPNAGQAPGSVSNGSRTVAGQAASSTPTTTMSLGGDGSGAYNPAGAPGTPGNGYVPSPSMPTSSTPLTNAQFQPVNNPFTLNTTQFGTINTNPATQGSSTSTTPGTGSGSSAAPTSPTTSMVGQQPYGSSPYLPSASQTANGQTQNYASSQMWMFPTTATAQTLAGQTGGTVTPGSYINGIPGGTQTPQNYVTLQNGLMVNPGQIAQFYTQGDTSQAGVDANIQNYLNGYDIGGGPGMNAQPGYSGGGGSYQVTGNGQITWVPGTPAQGVTSSLGNVPAAAIGSNLQGYNPGPGSQVTVNGQNLAQYLGTSQLPVGGNSPAAIASQGTNNGVAPGSTAPAASSTNALAALISALNSPQLASLYGTNPLAAAASIANSTGTANSASGISLNNLLSLLGQGSTSTNSSSNMLSIATLLNALYSAQNTPANQNLSPLFWGNAGQSGGLGVGMQNLYPAFP
jgi:hypothetical protein